MFDQCSPISTRALNEMIMNQSTLQSISPSQSASQISPQSISNPPINTSKPKSLSFSICRLIDLPRDKKEPEKSGNEECPSESSENESLDNNSDNEINNSSMMVQSINKSQSIGLNQSMPVCQVWNPNMDNLMNNQWMSPDLQRKFIQDKLFTRRIGHPYQSRAPAKHKKPRTSFNKEQVVELEHRFQSQKYLASSERATLAKALSMSDCQVKTWFQNRRTKWRRQASEQREEDRRSALRHLKGGPESMLDLNHPPSYLARPDVTY